MKVEYPITLSWCDKHNNWWITNCPDCMVDSNEEYIKRQGRKEVVEWFIEKGYIIPSSIDEDSPIGSQLKQWGLAT